MGKEATRKVVILLLILAIVFSAISIFIGWSALQADIPQRRAATEGSSPPGVVGFFVETPPSLSGGGG